MGSAEKEIALQYLIDVHRRCFVSLCAAAGMDASHLCVVGLTRKKIHKDDTDI
jgi:hypothetical protein